MASKYTRYYTYIEPVAKNPVVRSYAPYLFSLITVTVMAVFALKPTITEIISLKNEVDSKQKLLTDLKEKSANLTQGKQNNEKLNPEIRTKMDNLIPKSPNVPFLISSIQQSMPTGSSVSAMSVQPITLLDFADTAVAGSTLSKVEFSFNTSANFEEILGVLDKINNSARLIKIDSLNVSKRDEGQSVSISVTGQGFFVK